MSFKITLKVIDYYGRGGVVILARLGNGGLEKFLSGLGNFGCFKGMFPIILSSSSIISLIWVSSSF